MTQKNLAAVSEAVDGTARACTASAKTLAACNMEATENVSARASRANEDAAGRGETTMAEVGGWGGGGLFH